MLPYCKIQGGTLTATASTPQDITISSMNPPNYFEMKNITKWNGSGAGTLYTTEWWWEKSMSQGTANGINQTATTQYLIPTSLTTDGIYTYSTAYPPTFTANTTVTAVTRGSANQYTRVTLTNDGTNGPKINIGDYVRMINVVGMEQISGMVFQVLNITSTTSIDIDLDSSAFGANGTTATCQKIIPGKYYPRAQAITAISIANPCVISLTRDADFTVGEEVSLRIPSTAASFAPGWQVMNNVKGVVTAVTASTTTAVSRITVNIDTTGLSAAYTLPTSAQWVSKIGLQPISAVIPAGSGVIPSQNPPGTNLLDAFDNRNQYVIHLGGSIFTHSATSDIWEWQAYYYDEYNGQ